ncbi:MAG: hypothetical protein QXP53_01350 [Candidatus Pacearchaeota archaeon]
MPSLETIENKKAQVTFFIILAIVVVAAALLLTFFVFKAPMKIPPAAQEAESYFVECVKLKAEEMLTTAGMQGGWLYLPPFEAGSDFMPFSNYFNFLGLQIPYWFYISGNNIQKQQVPTKKQIEDQLNLALEEKIQECKDRMPGEVTFSGTPKVKTELKRSTMALEISWPMQIEKQDTKVTIEKHNTEIKTSFYSLFEDAKAIFEKENSTFFLENYSIDVLNLYAPTTRVEISCAPKMWSKQQVTSEIKEALASNIPMIKFKGNYYKIARKENEYFVVDLPVNNQINIFYSKNWPTKIDIWPTENDMLKAYPIGKQSGLDILGFCFLTYHFVYDLDFPVLIQVSQGNELFQFPVLVVIDKNVARKAETEESTLPSLEICNTKVQTATVFTFNQDSMPIEADIYFTCLDQQCYIGKTSLQEGKARLTEKFPECVNALLTAKSAGYEDTSVVISSNEPFIENIFLDKVYTLGLELELQANEKAIITFESENKKFSVFYPEQKEINLSEGTYNITAHLFKEATLNLESQSGEKCITLPSGGLGLPFVPKEECFELEIPGQSLTEVIFGGGYSIKNFNKQELKSSNKIKIVPQRFPVPTTIEKLAEIYDLIEISELQINLR